MIDTLDKDKILLDLSPNAHKKLNYFQVLSELRSTNDYLLDNVKNNKLFFSAICADAQTKGRGRQSKNWFSPPGCNIYLSLSWQFPFGGERLSGLSLAIGLGIAECFEYFGVPKLQIKWPNDIYCRDKKIAGVLIDIHAPSPTQTSVVIGIGINVSLSKHKNININQDWTDFLSEGITSISRNMIISKLLNILIEKTLPQFEQFGWEVFLQSWEVFDYLKSRTVQVQLPTRTLTGEALGIDQTGALRVLIDQKECIFNAGDVSVRSN